MCIKIHIRLKSDTEIRGVNEHAFTFSIPCLDCSLEPKEFLSSLSFAMKTTSGFVLGTISLLCELRNGTEKIR
jgi:hypothetical protein